MTFEEKVKTFLFKRVTWKLPYSQNDSHGKVIKICEDYLLVQCGLFTEGVKPEWIIHISK